MMSMCSWKMLLCCFGRKREIESERQRERRESRILFCINGSKTTQGGKFKSVYRKRVREQEVAGRGYTFGV